MVDSRPVSSLCVSLNRLLAVFQQHSRLFISPKHRHYNTVNTLKIRHSAVWHNLGAYRPASLPRGMAANYFRVFVAYIEEDLMVGMCTMKTAGVLMMWSRRIKGPHHHLFPCLAVLETLCVTGHKNQPVRRQNQWNSLNQLIWDRWKLSEQVLAQRKISSDGQSVQKRMSAHPSNSRTHQCAKRHNKSGDKTSETSGAGFQKLFLHKFSNCDSLSFLLWPNTKTESFTITI